LEFVEATMKCSKGVALLLFSKAIGSTFAFVPLHSSLKQRAFLTSALQPLPIPSQVVLYAGDDEDDEKPVNPYADPNYPDLEFVNYDDPEYQVDQGVGDEFFGPDDTEEQIEAMREERRIKNDEYQFETYYRDILKEGREYKGEWLVFQTSTFFPGMEDCPVTETPRLAMAGETLKVISRGERIKIDSSKQDSELEYQRLVHHENIYVESDDEKSPEQERAEEEVMGVKYVPKEISSYDFRGTKGIMTVGAAYTTCMAEPLDPEQEGEEHEGPFSVYRSEVGIQDDILRFRIKLDYSVNKKEKETMEYPPLHLKSLIVCRETLGMWPRNEKYKSKAEALTGEYLFGPAGAPGGLFDPPPVGSEEQAMQYLMLDLEGRATILFPYKMDQHPEAYPESGWVTSLDWTPGKNRFQVDRKVKGGKELLGLRTLELSEVASADADRWRPNDDGADMRQ
jgi:hypothetical protein